MSTRREKSERHRRLDFTQPADLPPPAWMQSSRRIMYDKRPSPWRRLLAAFALVGVLALAAVLWPAAFP